MTSAASKFWRFREPTTIAAPSKGRHESGERPGSQTRDAVREASPRHGRLPPLHDAGRNTFAFSHHNAPDMAASRTKPGQITPNVIAEKTQQQRRKKSSKPAHRADEAGNHSGVVRKVLRNEFENAAVAKAQQYGASQRTNGERHDRRPGHQQRERNDAGEYTPTVRESHRSGLKAILRRAASALPRRQIPQSENRRRPMSARTDRAAKEADRPKTQQTRRTSGSRKRRVPTPASPIRRTSQHDTETRWWFSCRCVSRKNPKNSTPHIKREPEPI